MDVHLPAFHVILDANVATAKLADAAVTTAKIADGNVVTNKLADDSVTTVKITWLTNRQHLFGKIYRTTQKYHRYSQPSIFFR